MSSRRPLSASSTRSFIALTSLSSVSSLLRRGTVLCARRQGSGFRFSTLTTTLLILAFLVTFVFFVRPGLLLEEFAFGFLFLFCAGQVIYIFVLAYGPYFYLADRLHHSLGHDGALWWRLVAKSVESGEGAAQKDIFPSLHTAAPTFLTLFAVRHRRLAIFRFYVARARACGFANHDSNHVFALALPDRHSRWPFARRAWPSVRPNRRRLGREPEMRPSPSLLSEPSTLAGGEA